MFMINHTLVALALTETGMPIAWLLPVALASHFALDAVPHWGGQQLKRWVERRPTFLMVAAVDGAVALAAFLIYVAGRPERAAAAFAACFFAVLPDIYHNLHRVGFSLKPAPAFETFHERIQHEFTWGWMVELVFAGILLALILYI